MNEVAAARPVQSGAIGADAVAAARTVVAPVAGVWTCGVVAGLSAFGTCVINGASGGGMAGSVLATTLLGLAAGWCLVRCAQASSLIVPAPTTSAAPERTTPLQAPEPGISRRPAPLQPVRAFSHVADALPHLVWQADARGVVQYANQSWLRNFRTLRPLRVEDMIELLADDDAGAFIGAWDGAQQAGSELRLRCRLRRPGVPEPRWTDLVMRPVLSADGDVDGWIGTCTDLHDAMAKIENAQQSLHEERRHRETAERLASMKDEFLATVSHELRSPLNAIAGWSEILSRERGLAASAVHAIGIIQRNARAQAKLIADLQQLTSMLTGKVSLSPSELDLGALVQRVVSQHQASATAKRIALVCVDVQSATVHADAARIALAVENLLANAIKYTAEGGRVGVAVRSVRDSARVTISDTGRGIATDRLPRLFDCLQPLDVASDTGRPVRRDGLGLGLAVTRGLVELHDGSVQASSGGVGTGSEFTINLPLSMPSPADDMGGGPPRTDRPNRPDAASLSLADASQTAPAPNVALDSVAGLTVLVLEANADTRAIVSVALTSLAARAVAVARADEAAARLRAERFDVLLCDAALTAEDAAVLRDALDDVGPGVEWAAGRTVACPTIGMVLSSETGDDNLDGLTIGGVLPCAATLRKPVSLRRLSSAIGRAMAARPNGAEGRSKHVGGADQLSS